MCHLRGLVLGFDVALSLGTPLWGQEAIRSSKLVVELRIGHGAGDSALSNVADLEVGPDGSIYVLQPMDQLIRVYDRNGTFLREVGRGGEGPGEFRRPLRLGWRADTLWTWDLALNRISLFSADGAFLRAISNRRTGMSFLLSTGDVLQRPDPPGRGLAGGSESSVPLLLVHQAGGDLDTIARFALGNSSMQVAVGGGFLIGRQPFTDDPLWTVSPTGTAVFIVERPAVRGSGEGHFRVTRLTASGDTVYARVYPYRPRRLDDRTVDTAVSALLDGMRRSIPPTAGLAGISEDAIRNVLYRPDNLPPVTRVVAGASETLWLMREAGLGDSVTWDVLNEEGVIVAALAVPTRMQLLRAEPDLAWGLERGLDDVPYVVRYRVEPAR